MLWGHVLRPAPRSAKTEKFLPFGGVLTEALKMRGEGYSPISKKLSDIVQKK